MIPKHSREAIQFGWCPGQGATVRVDRAGRKIRCPVCNKRLQPRTHIHDRNETPTTVTRFSIPPHKAKGKR